MPISVNEQKFELEIFPKMLAIWNINSYFPDVIEIDKPYTFYKKFFKYRDGVFRRELDGK